MTSSQNFNIGMFSEIFLIDLVQTWYDDRCYWTLHVDTSLIDLDLDSGHMRARKKTLLCQLSLKAFNRFEWNLEYC